MIINKYKKLSNGKYKIIFDSSEELICYEEVILNNNILLKKEIDSNLLKDIEKENEKYDTYYIAIKFLKVRIRSVKEVKEHLKKKDKSEKDILYALDRLTKEGYLDDDKFASAYINSKVLTTKQGPNIIIRDLLKLGINKNIINNKINIFTEDNKVEKINKYINSALNGNKKYGSNMIKQKIINKLLTDGYEKDLIIEEIQKKDILDNEEIFEKEYKKIKAKEKNEYKIKNKLYSLGFESETINKYIK